VPATAERTELTAPDAAEAIGIRIDRLRVLLKKRPAAAALFARVGAARVIRVERLGDLRRALGLSTAAEG
jgi:hypothetical protein